MTNSTPDSLSILAQSFRQLPFRRGARYEGTLHGVATNDRVEAKPLHRRPLGLERMAGSALAPWGDLNPDGRRDITTQ